MRPLRNYKTNRCCHLLRQLSGDPKCPSEQRAALGIASANFFTARYLTPLAKMGT